MPHNVVRRGIGHFLPHVEPIAVFGIKIGGRDKVYASDFGLIELFPVRAGLKRQYLFRVRTL